MIAKEKIIFWPLVVIFIGILFFGFISQGKNEEAAKELLKEIESATKKSKAKNKVQESKWDLEAVKAANTADSYALLLKRSPFFKVVDEKEASTAEPIVVEKEEPKEAILKYKGKVMMGSKVMVVIEDQGTGKSFFVKEGDMVGDFLVLRIDDKEVALKKKGGEEVVLSAVKKKESPDEDESLK